MKRISLLAVALIALACSRNLSIFRSAERFDTFYDKFHSDIGFQLERVRFPLEGTYEDATGVTRWDKSNWVMHQQKVTEITEPDYDTEIIRKESLVIDKVSLRGAGYNSERRFELIKGRWYLVYYDSSNL